MKNNRLTICILIIVLLSVIVGCKNIENEDNPEILTPSPSPASSITSAPIITPTLEPALTPTIIPTTEPISTPAITPNLTPEALSMDAYEGFLNNEMKLSFDHFMPKDYMGEALFKKGSEYTLLEVLDVVTTYYSRDPSDQKIDSIDYGYIDCGKDGVNELVLRFNGMDIYDKDDDSTVVYIIKCIDGKLSLCYSYETWARCYASINVYGYYQSAGSNGASNHGSEDGVIDKDGNWHPIVYIESETDINQLTWIDELKQLPKVAETKGISDVIQLDTMRFDYDANVADSYENGSKECCYTFYVLDENWELIEDANLYTDSIYQEIFDEASVPFITPEEVSALISEKEEALGATKEIKEGVEISWTKLSGDMFSAYVD